MCPMAKPKSYEVLRETTTAPKVVTALDGRPFESIRKGAKRHAAKKAVGEVLEKNPWDDTHQDPEAQRHQAHVVANSRRRTKPTRAAAEHRAFNDQ